MRFEKFTPPAGSRARPGLSLIGANGIRKSGASYQFLDHLRKANVAPDALPNCLRSLLTHYERQMEETDD